MAVDEAQSMRVDELIEQNKLMQEQIAGLQQAIASMVQHQQQMDTAAQHRELMAALSSLPNAMVAAVAAASPPRRDEGKQLVDIKGLGRPPMFPNVESEFIPWGRKVVNFIASVHPGSREMLAWSQESADPVTIEALCAEEDIDVDEDIARQMNEQIYIVLTSLTEKESADIVAACDPGAGFEAWRKLNRRWDPATTGRTRGILKEILSPGKCRLSELQQAVERLEDLMRRYCLRRDQDGRRHVLSEDIRMASLEQLLPDDVEKHCQLNGARLSSYQLLREEVIMFAEARGHLSYRPDPVRPESRGGVGQDGDRDRRQDRGQEMNSLDR